MSAESTTLNPARATTSNPARATASNPARATASNPAQATASIPFGSTASTPVEVGLGAGGECGGSDSHCITCSDVGVAMRVLELRDDCAICGDERGDSHEVAVELVLPVAVADEVLVHAGVAIRHLGTQR